MTASNAARVDPRNRRPTNGLKLFETLEGRVLLSGTPYLGSAFQLPTTIMADNFDHGGEGLTYHDTTSGNLGGQYRTTGVDIERSTDVTPPGLSSTSPGVGYNIGHITGGEWLQYTVNAPTSGNYDFAVRVASGNSGSFHFEFDNAAVRTASVALPYTGGWQTWKTVTLSGVGLSAGTHSMRLVFDSAPADIGNLGWIQITKSGTAPAPTPTPTPTPAPFAWKSITSSPVGKDEGQSAVLNGKLYAFGGFFDGTYAPSMRADVYNPATNSWTRLADMPAPISHAGTVVDGSTIWMLGGFIDAEVKPPTSAVWKYNTLTNTWSAGPSLPSGVGAGVATIVGRSIHLIGGLSKNSSGTFINTSEHWVLSLDGGTSWTNAAAPTHLRNHDGAVTLNGKIYVVGGQNLKDEFNGNVAQVDVYDSATNTWSSVASLPAGRSHIGNSVLVYNGKILVIGGETSGGTPRSDVLQYDPATNQWTTLNNLALPQARKAPVAGIVGNLLIVFGGANPNPLSSGWSGTLA